jgi:hypothetical protein
MVFVFLQRRHLMVWRVFAPKYVFEAIFLLVVDLLLIAVVWLLHTISKAPATNKNST